MCFSWRKTAISETWTSVEEKFIPAVRRPPDVDSLLFILKGSLETVCSLLTYLEHDSGLQPNGVSIDSTRPGTTPIIGTEPDA